MVFEQALAVLAVIFAPIISLKPHIALLIFSGIITALIIIMNRFTMKRDVVKQIKTKMEEIRENLAQAQKEGNKENADKFLKDMMQTNNEYMRQIFKGTIVSMIVALLFLPFLEVTYKGIPVARLPFPVPFVGTSLNWIGWYILASLAIGWILRKLFEGD